MDQTIHADIDHDVKGNKHSRSKYNPKNNGVKPYEWNNAKPESRQERRRRERLQSNEE